MRPKKLFFAAVAAFLIVAIPFLCHTQEVPDNWALKNDGRYNGNQLGKKDFDIGYSSSWIIVSEVPIIAVVDSPLFEGAPGVGEIIWNKDVLRAETVAAHGFSVTSIISSSSTISYDSILKNAKIYYIDIPEGQLDVKRLIDDLEAAEKSGVRVVNCSLSIDSFNKELYEYIKNSHMLFVCAAGNGGRNRMDYPAAFELENVISVVGAAPSGLCSRFSNQSEKADIAAPGEDIVCINEKGGMIYCTGTSYAAAYVTGAVAYIMSATQCPGELAKQIVLDTAQEVKSLEGFVQKGRFLSLNGIERYLKSHK